MFALRELSVAGAVFGCGASVEAGGRGRCPGSPGRSAAPDADGSFDGVFSSDFSLILLFLNVTFTLCYWMGR